MPSFALAVPIQSGKTQALRDYAAELTGPRRNDEEAFHRQAGTRREMMCLQQTPQGDFAVVYWEGDDPHKFTESLQQLIRSDDGFGAFVRDRFAEIFGVDPNMPLPPPTEPLTDIRLD